MDLKEAIKVFQSGVEEVENWNKEEALWMMRKHPHVSWRLSYAQTDWELLENHNVYTMAQLEAWWNDRMV